MGIHLNLAVLLREIAAHHRLGGRVATFGEQAVPFDPGLIAPLPEAASFAASSRPSETQSPASQLFARLGFVSTESIDVDPAEAPTHLFDLNRPQTPSELVERFDLLINGGVLEHVFDVPNALAHMTRMLRPGGVALHVLPCNNWADHGFYQFSPTLMFDYYAAAGFECLESLLLGFAPEQPDRWVVRCAPRGLLGEGLAGTLDEKIYLHLFAARRGRDVDANPVPRQRFYVPDDDTPIGSRPRWFTTYLLDAGRHREIPPQGKIIVAAAALTNESGFAWTIAVPKFSTLSDTLAAPTRSPLILLEDGVPLGPAHAAHDQIRSRGRGRFSHWGGHLWFSSSDNSPPIENGRAYVAVIPGAIELGAKPTEGR